MLKPKILKVYETIIQTGRDIGYSKTEYRVYDNLKDMALNYGKNKNETYYDISVISSSKIKEIVDNELKKVNEEKEKLQYEKDLEKYNELKKKLGK